MSDTFYKPATINDRREVQLLSLAFIFLLTSSLTKALSPGAKTGVWDLSLGSFQHFLFLPVWVIGVFLVSRSIRRKFPNRDPFILPIGALLAGWGLIAIWRFSPTFGLRQTGWFLLSALVLIGLFRSPADLKWLRHYRYLWLGGGLFLLALTLIFGTNPLGGDPKLWLGCCGFYFQPSEPLRLLLIAFLASYFADRLVFRNRENPPALIETILPLLVVWSLSTLLLFVQKDLGTGSLFIILLAVLLYIASEKWLVLIAAAGMTLIGGVIAFLNMDLVRIRIDAWLNPWLDPVGGSYQIVQSLIAVASGGILGTGVGMGEPNLVPAAHTDFIFAAIGEEWGLLGALGMLGLFAVLVARGIKIAARSQHHFDKLLASGLSITFAFQSVLIIAGVTRLLPLTGITLPFVSYGGSSLLTSFIALGLLLQISNKATHEPEFTTPLRNTQMGFFAAWLAIGLVLIWWSVYRAPSLTSRTDNLRRTLGERYYPRGTIFDSNGEILAESRGTAGTIERTYPQAETTSVIGYQSTLFGKSGIESSMDPILHGDEGHDPFNLAWSILLEGHPPSGLDVTLTLDLEVQEFAVTLVGDNNGALILMDAESGEIRSMVTSPSYDPNMIEEGWDGLITNENAPLLNRTTQARYQPGMAIVPFLLAWGEDQGHFKLDDVIDDAFSTVLLGEYELGCSRVPQIGHISSLHNALNYGCPAAFAVISRDQGAEWLVEAYDAFGFTDQVPIRMGTATEVIIDETLLSSQVDLAGIGQGQLIVTPIEVARAFAAIASNGTMPAVNIVQSIRNPDGRWVEQEPLGLEKTVISPTTARRIMNSSRIFQDNVRGFSFSAITGPEGQTSSWFMATDGGDHVLVLLLEDGTTSQVENIGQSLFQYLAETQSP